MRILIITPLYPPAVGGAATYFGQLGWELARRRELQKIVVLTERKSGKESGTEEGKLAVHRQLPPRVGLEHSSRMHHLTSYVQTQFWFRFQLPSLTRRLGIDLIHFHTRHRGRLFYQALRRCRLPVIADLRDRMGRLDDLIGVADHLLCCSEGVWRHAQDSPFPRDRMSLIPIPFTPVPPDIERVQNIVEQFGLEEGPYLLFVGDMTAGKGVYELLRAFRHWRRKHPDCRLVLTGLNREGSRFTAAVADTAGAVYLGPTASGDARALMKGAEMVILPSRSEGLPRVILEALSVKTKVICPPGVPEFERHLSDFVLRGTDAEAILEKIVQVWSGPGVPAYPFQQHQTGAVTEQLLQIYRQLCR